MNEEVYYVVRYSGPFGYIKPWTAVRDGGSPDNIHTFSQQFLTPSILCGMERKLFPELLDQPFALCKIAAYRLSYSGISGQLEQTQPRGWNKKAKHWERPRAILVRGVMLNPVLQIAFRNEGDAIEAAKQHLCLCRNEDIVLPESKVRIVSVEEFDQPPFDGFELVFAETDQSFVVGYNRFDGGSVMRGWLKIVGNPVQAPTLL